MSASRAYTGKPKELSQCLPPGQLRQENEDALIDRTPAMRRGESTAFMYLPSVMQHPSLFKTRTPKDVCYTLSRATRFIYPQPIHNTIMGQGAVPGQSVKLQPRRLPGLTLHRLHFSSDMPQHSGYFTLWPPLGYPVVSFFKMQAGVKRPVRQNYLPFLSNFIQLASPSMMPAMALINFKTH
eukprot:1160236-Pelagomonas_calceolata.AAC.2